MRSAKELVVTSTLPGNCPLNTPETEVAAPTVSVYPSAETAVTLLRLASVLVPAYET